MGLREGRATRPPDRPTDAPRAVATSLRRDEEKVLQPPPAGPAGPPGPGPSGAWRSAAGRRAPWAPQLAGAGGVCERLCVRVAGGAAGTMWASPSGRPCRARARARGQVAAGARLTLPSRPRPRPTRVTAAAGAPGPAGAGASFLFVCKVAPGRSASGLKDAAAGRVGGPGPVGPTARAFVWVPRARRGLTETGRGASLGRRGESGTRRVRSAAAAAGGSRDPRWQYLAWVGFRGENNLSWDQGGRNLCIKQSPGCVYGVNLLREDSCVESGRRKWRF